MNKLFIKYKEQLIIAVLGGLIVFIVSELLKYVSSKINYKGIWIVVIDLIKYKISLSVQTLLLMFIIYFLFVKIYKRYKNKALKLKGLFILSAKYGAKGKYIDIKNELNDRITGGKLEVVLDNYIAGDPIVGEKKECKVRYQYNKEIIENTYNEFETIKLPKQSE